MSVPGVRQNDSWVRTEILWFGSTANLRKLSANELNIRVGFVKPVTTVRNLGVLIDAELSMRDHVSRLAQTCIFHLRRLRSVRRQLGQDVTERLVCALVLLRLDYCNAVLAGLPASTLAPLQRVLRVAARVVLDLKPRDHISSALRELHWLPVGERVVYKLCFLVHKASLGQSQDYITDLLQPVAATSSRSSLRDASRGDCRATDEPENGGSSIFHCCTASVEPTAD